MPVFPEAVWNALRTVSQKTIQTLESRDIADVS
jgi:hypothetical protein